MQTTADYTCAYCGETSTTFVDLSAGFSQRYVEDCQVCCRPNVIYVTVDEDTLEVTLQTDYEE